MRKPIHHLLRAILLFLALVLPSAGYSTGRIVRAVDRSVSRGETNRLAVLLEAQGDENRVKFSLCYDANLLAFIEAVRGSDATNAAATLDVDSSQAAGG